MKVKKYCVLLLAGLTVAACGDGTATKDTNNGKDTGKPDAGENDGTDSENDTGEPAKVVYEVTVDGESVPVVRMSNFVVPVNYVQLTYSGSDLDIEIKADSSFTDYTLGPRSKNIEATHSDDTLSFTAEEAAYLVLQIPGQERLFILIDPKEVDPPELGDANVKNIMDYDGIDNIGETDVTEILQAAIDEASGAERNVVYVPEGTYSTMALFLKDDMTLYLARGALLKSIIPAGMLSSQPEELVLIEDRSRAVVYMDGVENAKLKGRGTIDGNAIDDEGNQLKRKLFLLKIQNSKNCEVEGIVSRNSPFWNTIVYRSDQINISNYKVINNRLDDDYNETDGVDFDNSTNSTLKNAFLYTGDDCMAVKSDDVQDGVNISSIRDPTPEGSEYMAVDNISHEQIVCFSGSAACKVGTKTFGETMNNITFKDIDVITANRAMVIDAGDTASISNTTFEDIRIDDITGRLVDFNMDPGNVTWRVVVGTCTVTDTRIINVSSDKNASCRIMGNIHDWDEEDPYYGEEYYINGVTFENFTVEGQLITSLDDGVAFDTNEYATDITFLPLPD